MTPRAPTSEKEPERSNSPPGSMDAKPSKFDKPFEAVEPIRPRVAGGLKNRLNTVYLLGWAWTKKHWVISATALLLGVFAFMTRDRTVTWEEEVPLNTGEVIWVKRVVTYKLQGAGANPLDIAYWPDWTEEIAFEWKGQKYRYVGDADLMLLAISPHTQRPVLVANAAQKNWDSKHNYRCTKPYYVQLVPDDTGHQWAWPPTVEPWLFGMRANMMLHRDKIDDVKPRYESSARARLDAGISQFLIHIDPTHYFDSCKK